MTKFAAFLRDESGASAAEYVLILAIVGTVIVTAVGVLATAIGDKINSTATVINP
jgi:pilus assembly protein Flp/PilA